MQESSVVSKEVLPTAVGSLPDRMGYDLKRAVQYRELPERFTKESAAAFLYQAGYPMTDVVEYIDDAIEIARRA